MSDLTSLTLIQARKKLSTRDISSVELVSAFLSRIDRLQKKLNVFVTINVDAIKRAHEADEYRKKHSSIDDGKSLLGIPIAVKDNFLTKGLRTTASSKVLDNFIPPYESTVTRKLLDAGAIIIGKTNMDAWAHGSSTETSDYGATRNPWNINHLPGGSSGGSAAAVAADLCTAAIGSETAGSIRQPASWCGCVGLKPSYGRISRYGVVAMASSTDSPGPLTKTVEDSEELLSIISGHDKYDATSMPGTWQVANGFPKKIRIGIVTDYFLSRAQKGVNECVMNAINVLKKEGYEVKEISLMDPKYAIADYTIIQRAEVSSNLARYDGIRYGNGREFFAQEAKRRIMLGTYVLSSGYSEKYYRKAQQVRTAIIKDFARAFEDVDVLVAPTSPSVALPIGATEGASMFGELQDVLVEASSMAGLPGISVPCGCIDGLPVGLQITGRMEDEASVISVAKTYESLTDWHTKNQGYEGIIYSHHRA